MIKIALNQVEKQGRKVIVAMSGGVDSSVAAALLKKQGFDIAGVFMRFWKEGRSGRNTCCSAGAEQAARNVAAKLGIPFYILRLEKEFKKEVVDYFLREIIKGRTPNPCIVCNKKIKFGLLFKKAMGMGADYIATGHYVRLWRQFPISNFQFPNKTKISNPKSQIKLFRAKDNDKDQSYFLYTLTQKQLNRVFFPLGDYTKEQVYQMAKKWRLPFRQGESFDLCFVANDTESFLKKYLKIKPGKIMDLADRILGEHPGLAYYTIGQRKNIFLQQGPWWVVRKDEKRNILYVSNNEKDLYSRKLGVNQLNWISGQPPRLRQGFGGQAKLPMKVWAKIRYKSEAAVAVINPKSEIRNSKQLEVKFNKPQRAITPGQSVVFYKNSEILGGGVILK